MKHTIGILWGLLLVWSNLLLAQTTISITTLPASTPNHATIYIAGNFNGWHPQKTPLTRNEDGTYSITFPKSDQRIEYKFTRGSWQTGECRTGGSFLPNRMASLNTQQVIKISIQGWDDLSGKPNRAASTANENVLVLTDSFFMPSLNRYRRVWIYLPSNYHTSTKRYPVLYMHDGQNVFDAATAFTGEWQVDETLKRLETSKGIELIAVAIDNGDQHRLDEYNPWTDPKYGGGAGDTYVKWMASSLKPFIDSLYRTQPEAQQTGIMGSSMGGLISMYAILQYPDVFGKAGVFSPSFWIADNAYLQARYHAVPEQMKIYLLVGEQEGASMTKGFRKMKRILQSKGFNDKHLQCKSVPHGKHKEWFWAAEFAQAVEYLFTN